MSKNYKEVETDTISAWHNYKFSCNQILGLTKQNIVALYIVRCNTKEVQETTKIRWLRL
jgi:hypothetical protein